MEDQQGPSTSECTDASDCIRGTRLRGNADRIGDPSAVSDGPKAKRKHVVRIVARRTLPPRSARVSSFAALESGQGVVDLPHVAFKKEGHLRLPQPYLEPAEMLEAETVHDLGASTSLTDNLVNKIHAIDTERHFLAHQLGESVWPLLSQEAVDFTYASNVIVGMCQVPAEQICHSVPQKYTNTGTFIVDLSEFGNRHEVAMDGLGSWGKPQGSSRFYKLVGAIPIKLPSLDGADFKVLCNRYEHPGTKSDRGRFIRKIMAGVSTPSGRPLSTAVIVYEWLGEPHPILLNAPDSVEPSKRPYGSRSWEPHSVDTSRDEGLEFDGQPLYAKVAVDFDAVARLILGAETVQPNRLCSRIAQSYRTQGTFVVDLSKLGNDMALRRDGNGKWSKPSGCSRYYRLLPNNEVIRIDKALCVPGSTDVIQILSKRYENSEPLGSSFVRKIYMGKTGGADQQQMCAISVITYLWKGCSVPLELDQDPIPHTKHSTLETEEGSTQELVTEETCTDAPPPKITNRGIEGKRMGSNDGRAMGAQNYTDNAQNKETAPLTSLRSANVWEGETSSLDSLVLNHTDHLKRLALAKQLDNQNRLSSILDRAEQFLDRFEQTGVNLGLVCTNEPQYVIETGEEWEGQPVENVANTVNVGGGGTRPEDEAQYLTTGDGDRMSGSGQSDFMSVHYQCAAASKLCDHSFNSDGTV